MVENEKRKDRAVRPVPKDPQLLNCEVGAKRFRTSNSQGPMWSDVVRRITRDLMNDRIVDDEDITEGAMAKKLYRRLPDGIEDVEATLVYRRVEGNSDPGKPITTDPPGGQVKKDDRHPKQEDARLVDAGMKRGLEGAEVLVVSSPVSVV